MRYFLLAAAITMSFNTMADTLLSDASALGVNAGAMDYCAKNYSTSSNKDNYKRLAVIMSAELLKLDNGKAKALLVKKSTEDSGKYLGKKLNTARCNDLRKVMAAKYLTN